MSRVRNYYDYIFTLLIILAATSTYVAVIAVAKNIDLNRELDGVHTTTEGCNCGN